MPSHVYIAPQAQGEFACRRHATKEPAKLFALLSTASCIAFNKASAANGFLRKSTAPDFNALARAVGSSWAVMKIIGIRH
jgi:hypothetical protein